MAVYLEPWHGDIKSFINLRRKTGDHDIRARDLHLALWVPDLFWERVKRGEKWSLFDPATAPGLFDRYGDDFVALYEKYEIEGRAIDVVDARELLKDIFEVLIETGEPYILNKDHANNKSNQKNLGTIKSSNLCTEIIEYSDENETAICNLASVCLPKYVKGSEFDHERLHDVVKFMTKALNKVIDVNYYINEKTRKSNFRHRPIGIGVQGLADVFFKLKIPYTSKKAMSLNKEIFETIYHAALEASMELAKKDGTYESYRENGGCPASKGILQFDLWGVSPDSGRYDWDKLKDRIIKNGLRNSLLLAPMPTASTSQIFWNTESFEPLTENLYKRKTSAGEFTIVNKYLVYHLDELGLWNKKTLEGLIKNNGSIQQLPLPDEVKEVYKTVWELPLKQQIEMAAERGYFICQSQSFNIHMDSPSMERMKDVYLYAHKMGLKTASYYFRTNPATNNQKVTVSKDQVKENKTENGDDDCIVCSS
jgi:ribonucleoside-diphosphate reductase alpha chain